MYRMDYFRRIFKAYYSGKTSHLDFWHEVPQINQDINYQALGQYYQSFATKAGYDGYFDDNGVILLDYHGKIGKQYYHIAIAQYGLACFNRYKKTGNKEWLDKAVFQGNWLVGNLTMNKQGYYLWYANFDWEYRDLLKAPWPSALAQGNGISLLVRLYQETQNKQYLETSRKAYQGLIADIKTGGVAFIDEAGDLWLEEYIVSPPTHILNGFMWTAMGVYDYYLLTKDKQVEVIFYRCIETLKKNLYKYDIGFWSLYELSGTRIKMIASHYYHSLHIIQLTILYNITGEPIFNKFAERWHRYDKNIFYKIVSWFYKAVFKLIYY